jgi:hypothetical protein
MLIGLAVHATMCGSDLKLESVVGLKSHHDSPDAVCRAALAQVTLEPFGEGIIFCL